MWLVPQYPDRHGDQVVVLSQSVLEGACRGEFPLAIETLTLDGFDFVTTGPGYQGIEATVVDGDTAYMMVEADLAGHMSGELYRAHQTGPSRWRIDADWQLSLPVPVQLHNMAYEAIVVLPSGELLVVFERNGAQLRPGEVTAYVVDPSTHAVREVSFPAIDHRITDATAMDEAGRFWVTVYRWEGDTLELADGRTVRGAGGARV